MDEDFDLSNNQISENLSEVKSTLRDQISSLRQFLKIELADVGYQLSDIFDYVSQGASLPAREFSGSSISRSNFQPSLFPDTDLSLREEGTEVSARDKNDNESNELIIGNFSFGKVYDQLNSIEDKIDQVILSFESQKVDPNNDTQPSQSLVQRDTSARYDRNNESQPVDPNSSTPPNQELVQRESSASYARNILSRVVDLFRDYFSEDITTESRREDALNTYNTKIPGQVPRTRIIPDDIPSRDDFTSKDDDILKVKDVKLFGPSGRSLVEGIEEDAEVKLLDPSGRALGEKVKLFGPSGRSLVEGIEENAEVKLLDPSGRALGEKVKLFGPSGRSLNEEVKLFGPSGRSLVEGIEEDAEVKLLDPYGRTLITGRSAAPGFDKTISPASQGEPDALGSNLPDMGRTPKTRQEGNQYLIDLQQYASTDPSSLSYLTENARRLSRQAKIGDPRVSAAFDPASLRETIKFLEQQKENIGNQLLSAPEGEDVTSLEVSLQENDALITAMSSLEGSLDKVGKNTQDGIAQLAASVIGALSIQQFLMTRFVSQPYQYQTVPALSAVGNTGAMGEVLSSAYGAQESILQEYRTMGVASAGAVGAAGSAGIAAMVAKAVGSSISSRGLGLIGSAGAIAGLGLGIANQDRLADFLDFGMKEEGFQAELGKQIINPQRYTEEFFRPTLQARVGLGLGSGEIVEDLAGYTTEQTRGFGYDAVQVGQLLGNYLSVLSPQLSYALEDREGGEYGNLVDITAGLESFGMSKDMIYSVMSDISRSGSEDYQQSLASLLLATADDGDITNYTANVLVPALSKVVESRSIQNIAKSSEEVSKETAGLFSFFKNSDTNLGKMLSANPEMMGQIFGMLDQVSNQAIQDPALMLYLNRMGLSFSDVATGDPRALMMPLQSFANMAEYDASGNINLDSAASISAIVGFLEATGIGVSTGGFNIIAEIMTTLQQGGVFDPKDLEEKLKLASPDGQIIDILSQMNERLGAATEGDGGDIIRDRVEQSNEFFMKMEDNVDSIRELQSLVKSALSNTLKINDQVLLAGYNVLKSFADTAGINIDDIVSDSYKENYQAAFFRNQNYEDQDYFTVANMASQLEVSPSVLLEQLDIHRRIAPLYNLGVDYTLTEDQRNLLRSLGLRRTLSNEAIIGSYTALGLSENVNDFFTSTLQMDYKPFLNVPPGLEGYAVGGTVSGGYTGAGSRLDVAGFVHGGEYVISDNNVSGNINTLNRIQSGESLDEFSSETTSSGDTIRVTLEFSNTNPQAIINAAQMSARQMLIDERIL